MLLSTLDEFLSDGKGSSLPGLYHIMGTSGTLAPANKIDWAQVNQLRQGLHYEVLNVVVLR